MVRFEPVQAQQMKVAFTRTFTPSADGVFLDDIEVYSTQNVRTGLGRPVRT
ncbi:hypothetical protein ACFVWG_15700 [Kribbella sp. NPDC058245]|uniref:hypothetical protein n=1 Tax=Kribbella sp. NPDC058245 TaxID=3346399 RepID=UPI0036EF0CAC